MENISPTLPPAPPPPPPAPPPTTTTVHSQISSHSPEPSSEVVDKQDEAVISLDSNNYSNNPSELVDLLMKIEDEIRKTDQQIQQLRKKQVGVRIRIIYCHSGVMVSSVVQKKN